MSEATEAEKALAALEAGLVPEWADDPDIAGGAWWMVDRGDGVSGPVAWGLDTPREALAAAATALHLPITRRVLEPDEVETVMQLAQNEINTMRVGILPTSLALVDKAQALLARLREEKGGATGE